LLKSIPSNNSSATGHASLSASSDSFRTSLYLSEASGPYINNVRKSTHGLLIIFCNKRINFLFPALICSAVNSSSERVIPSRLVRPEFNNFAFFKRLANATSSHTILYISLN
jgi:hypothetical protein